MPPRVAPAKGGRGRGRSPRGSTRVDGGRNVPRGRGADRGNVISTREMRHNLLTEERHARETSPAEVHEDQRDVVLEEVYNEVSQEKSHETIALPVPAETEILLQRMATMIAGAIQTAATTFRTEARNDNRRKIFNKNHSKGKGNNSGQHQYSRKKRSRDEIASGGSVQFRAPRQTITTATPSQSQTSKGPIVCHGCGTPGHIKPKCPSRLRLAPRSVSTTACFKCGQEGHKVRVCPQSQGAGGSHLRGTSQSAITPQGFEIPTVPVGLLGTVSQGSEAGSTAPREDGQQGRAYVATISPTPFDPSVVKGTFFVFSS